jgi:hypothetical protein
VGEDVRTLGDFVKGALNLKSFAVSSEAIEALIDEIWNAPANANLQKVPRDHRGGSKNSALEVAPDEWIYLPFMPPPGYELRRFPLAGNETSEDEICQKILAQFVELGMDFPGDHMAPPDLENIVFNSVLRSGATPTEVYFYVVPSIMITTDVAPVTDATPGAPTVAHAKATPDWLLPLWHWIDRLHNKAQQHSAMLQDLFDLCSEGKMIADALATVDKFLTVVERECKVPPPKSILERIGAAFDPAGHIFDISDFHGKLTALRKASQQGYVDTVPFPTLPPFQAVSGELAALDSDPDFLTVYKKFKVARARYPVTEHALQTVLAFYLMCRGMSPDGDDFAAKIDKAVHGSPEQTPLFLEIGEVLKSITDNVIVPATVVAGNAPGPLTLVIAFGKLHLLWQLKTPKTAVISLEQYLERAAKLSGVAADDITGAVKGMGKRGKARLFATRVQAAELALENMESSSRWMKAVAFLDIAVVISATCNSIDDIKKKGLFSVSFGVDSSAAGSAGAGIAGAVISVRLGAKQSVVLALKQAGKLEAAGLAEIDLTALRGMTKICGRLVAGLGLISGIFQVVQGIRDHDAAEKWIGIGTVAISLQPIIDFFFARAAGQIGARVAMLLADVVVEETAVAAGSAVAAVAAGLGAAIAGIGVLVVLGFIIYKNRSAIKAFLEDQSTPGPAKACAAYLKFIESARAYTLGPGGVRTALDQAKQALEHAMFVNFFPSDKVKAELKADGMSEEDLRVVGTLAPLSIDMMAGAAAAG